MSTSRKIAHNTLVQIVGKVISTLLGVVALLMLTHYLGAERFGWYTTTISFLGFAGILIDFGLIPVTAQMLSDTAFNKTKLLQNLLGFRLVTAVIFFVIAPLVALFFPYPIEVKLAIALSAVSFMGNAMNQIFIGYYQTKLKMHIQAIGEVTGRLVLVIGLWLFMFYGAGFLPIMSVIVAGSLTYTIVLWLYAQRDRVVGFAYEKTIWKAIMVKSWPIAISIMFNVVYLKGDILILAHFFSQTDVGIYGAAYRVIDILSQMAMMLMGILLPLLAYHWSRQKMDQFKVYYQQAFDLMMLFALPVLVGIILTADKLVPLLGDSFSASAAPLKILTLALFGVYLGAVFGHTAVAIDKQKQTMWIYISNAIITLVGYLIFIPRFGIMGAAWMTVFSELYTGILLWLTIRRFTRQRLRGATFCKLLVSALVMGLIIYLLSAWPIWLILILAAVVYLAMLFITRAFRWEMFKELVAKGR